MEAPDDGSQRRDRVKRVAKGWWYLDHTTPVANSKVVICPEFDGVDADCHRQGADGVNVGPSAPL